MLIRVSDDGRSLSLEEVDDFTRLNILAADPDTSTGLASFRRTDDGHFFVPAETLVELAGPASGADGWRSSFDDMVAFAARSGWTDADGSIRVHVVSPAE